MARPKKTVVRQRTELSPADQVGCRINFLSPQCLCPRPAWAKLDIAPISLYRAVHHRADGLHADLKTSKITVFAFKSNSLKCAVATRD
jgi:hypothetical protein